MELLLDFKCSCQSLMRDKDALEDWLLQAVDEVGMTAFGNPEVVDYPFPEREGTALSAVIFLGESSITIHTYPEFNFVFMNIFSCKDFDPSRVLEFIERSWNVSRERRAYLFQRGINMETGTPLSLELKELPWANYIGWYNMK